MQMAQHGAVPARTPRELAQVEVVAGDEEQDAHPQARHEREPLRGVDDAQAVGSQCRTRGHEEHDLGMGRPGMRLAANDDSTTTASIVASIASSVVMGLLLVGLDPSVLPNMADTSA